MTIRIRNQLCFGLLIASLIWSLSYLLLLIVSVASSTIMEPPATERLFTFLASPYRFSAAVAAAFVFTAYVPAVAAAIRFGFEKTQSQELVYFGGFLLGCMLESVRLLPPLANLWQTPSAPLAFITRLATAGRTLAFLSMLAAALFYGVEFRQSVEQNFIVCVLIALLAGMSFPLNTLTTTTSFTVALGRRGLFTSLRLGLATATILAMFAQGIKNNAVEQKYEVLGCTLLLCGHAFLCGADNYLHLILGTFLLSAGTVIYLKSIHTIYLWR